MDSNMFTDNNKLFQKHFHLAWASPTQHAAISGYLVEYILTSCSYTISLSQGDDDQKIYGTLLHLWGQCYSSV